MAGSSPAMTVIGGWPGRPSVEESGGGHDGSVDSRGDPRVEVPGSKSPGAGGGHDENSIACRQMRLPVRREAGEE
jgi:hypothetical protein